MWVYESGHGCHGDYSAGSEAYGGATCNINQVVRVKGYTTRIDYLGVYSCSDHSSGIGSS